MKYDTTDEANCYVLFTDKGNWIAHIRLNGELPIEYQKSIMDNIAKTLED